MGTFWPERSISAAVGNGEIEGGRKGGRETRILQIWSREIRHVVSFALNGVKLQRGGKLISLLWNRVLLFPMTYFILHSSPNGTSVGNLCVCVSV